MLVDLLAYLRAHLLVEYEGADLARLLMTEPVSLDYELLVLEQYQYILLNLKEGRYAGLSVELEAKALGQS